MFVVVTQFIFFLPRMRELRSPLAVLIRREKREDTKAETCSKEGVLAVMSAN